MRTWMAMAVAATALMACGDGDDDDSGSTSLDHVWAYASADGTTGVGLTFTSDGKYELAQLQLTSGTSANVQEEVGTYAVSGSTITFTPQQATCSGKDGVAMATYLLTNSSLTVSLPSGLIVFQLDTSTSNNEAITLGCFDSSGNFTPSPLATVSN